MEANILVIDDDRRIVNMLRRAFVFAGYRVSSALDGPSGLRLAREQPQDLVVLDLMLPGMDGIEVCMQLRTAAHTPILMLTARDDVPDRVRGLDAGADDYLAKPFAVDELLARVRALLRRAGHEEVPAAPEVLSFANLTLDTGTYTMSRDGRPHLLSAIECRLLQYFMCHPNQVLTRAQLIEEVWGYDYEEESNVLEVYIHRLRTKQESDDLVRVIHTVRGVGYALRA